MSYTSLCVTVLLLPPEGHINILPAPLQPHSPPQVTLIHIQRHDYKNINRRSFTYSLTVFVACPQGQLGCRTRPVPIWRLLVPRPVWFPLPPPWLNQAGHFCGGGREGGRKTREGERSYCQTLDKQRHTVPDKSHKLVFLFLRPSFPPAFSFISSEHSMFEKWINVYTIYDSEKQNVICRGREWQSL